MAVGTAGMRPESRKVVESVLKHERHSHHQVERVEELPQHVADLVDGGIAICIYYM